MKKKVIDLEPGEVIVTATYSGIQACKVKKKPHIYDMIVTIKTDKGTFEFDTFDEVLISQRTE